MKLGKHSLATRLSGVYPQTAEAQVTDPEFAHLMQKLPGGGVPLSIQAAECH